MTKRKLRFEEDRRIREPALEAALKANPSLELEIVGRKPAPGCLIRVYLESGYRVLTNSRNQDRAFASIDAAALFARDLGATVLKLDLSKYVLGRVRAPRPDRAEALRQLHESGSSGRRNVSKP